MMMYIQDISIEKSITMPGTYILRIESANRKFTGHFGKDLHMFFEVVSHALKFYGQVHGLIVPGETESTSKPGPRGGKKQ